MNNFVSSVIYLLPKQANSVRNSCDVKGPCLFNFTVATFIYINTTTKDQVEQLQINLQMKCDY